jgi:hypothetical protein
MTQSKILNSREVMTLLMICENTLIKLEKAGNIKVDFYVGNRKRYYQDNVLLSLERLEKRRVKQ